MKDGGAGIRLADLARSILGSKIVGADATEIAGASQDSRHVRLGDLFVARVGERSDGTRYVAQAKANGAVALAVESELSAEAAFGLPQLVVRDLPREIGPIAHHVFGDPTATLRVAGVTGTNGKTTTTHLIASAVDAAAGDRVSATIGTVGHRFRELHFEAAHTTPEADTLARVLFDMKVAGAQFAAMEVSSIALALERTRGIHFEVAAFTNLTQDHLDFHGTMDAYEREKAKLFTDYSPKAAVIHVGDRAGARLAASISALTNKTKLLRVTAATDPSCDIFVERSQLSSAGISATLGTPEGRLEIVSPLSGAHNLENLVVTLGVVHAFGLDLRRAVDGLREATGAPGRLERASGPTDDITVLVDYAHTPDALARVLSSCRPFTTGRILCVFGCGGDRDPTKREPMGRAVAHGADIAIVTSDNPRSEDPMAIVAVVGGAVHQAGLRPLRPTEVRENDRGYVIFPDRKEAIELAVSEARPGDLVLIAGKGHETYQILGDEKIHFDDREEARLALKKRRA